MSVPQYQIFVDWNNDHDFLDAGEDVSARTFGAAVRWERGRDQARQLAPPMAGAFAATLDNSSGDYSPENTGSPLAGNVEPGRALKLEAVSGGTVALWGGFTEEPTLDSERRTLGLRALGQLARLRGQRVSTRIHRNINVSQAIGELLNPLGASQGIGFASAGAGRTILTAWWCDDDDIFDMLVRLLAAEGPGAALYEQPGGTIIFEHRHVRLTTARCTTPQATLRDTGADPLHVPPFRYDRGQDAVVNSASIAVRRLDAGAAATLWTHGGVPFAVAAGQTVKWEAVLQRPGENVTAVWTLQPYVSAAEAALVSVALGPGTPTSGRRITVAVTNGNPRTMTLDSFQLYGNDTTDVDLGTATNSVDTTASQARHGLRTLPTSYNPWPYIARAGAQDCCDAIVQAYQNPRPTVAITVENATATDLAQVLNREISDRVTIVDANSYLNHEFFVERLAHEVSEAGRRHRLTLGCEKAGSINYAIWGTSTWGGASWGF